MVDSEFQEKKAESVKPLKFISTTDQDATVDKNTVNTSIKPKALEVMESACNSN